MNTKFAQLEVFITEDIEVGLIQPMDGNDEQFISFPPHQAKAICDAIMLAAGEANTLTDEMGED